MTTELHELNFLEYAKAFNQKLTFALLKINDCKDITEEEELLLKEVFRIQWFGNYPLYVTKLTLSEETSTQQGLFCQNVSSTDDGKIIDYSLSEPKTLKDETE